MTKDHKCRNTKCKKTAHFDDGFGWKFCLEHWVMDYKYGRCHGLWTAIKQSKLINIF